MSWLERELPKKFNALVPEAKEEAEEPGLKKREAPSRPVREPPQGGDIRDRIKPRKEMKRVKEEDGEAELRLSEPTEGQPPERTA